METLQKLIQLRNQLAKLQIEIQEIMPFAIAEALDIYAQTKAENGNKIIFKHQLGKIGLVFKTRYLTTKEDATLARIDETILNIQGTLAQKYSGDIEGINTEIEQLQNQITLLTEKQDQLLTNKQIIKLKHQFTIRREASAYLDPNLNVFLN